MRVSLSALAMIIIGGIAPPVEAAGTDCAKPVSASDHMICQDKSLLAQDKMMGALYASALTRDDADKIREKQQRWIAKVQSCGDANCIRLADEDQVGFLLYAKGVASASTHFTSKRTDGNKSRLSIFGPVDGFVAVGLDSMYFGPDADAGDINSDSITGAVPLTKEHAELSRDKCRIGLNRLNAKTWRVSQTGSCFFADGVTFRGIYRKH